MPQRSLPDAINAAIKAAADPNSHIKGADCIVATWKAAENVDANLSYVLLPGGQPARFIPKASGLTLSPGDPVTLLCYPNGTYYIINKPVGNSLLADASLALPDAIPPTTPGNPSVGSPTTSTLALSWTPSTDASGVAAYDVYYSNGSFIASALTNAYNVGGLVANTSYSFIIRARDIYGNLSAFSGVGTGSTSATPAPNPSAPITYSMNYAATWSASYGYQGHNEFDDWFGSQCNQGKYTGGNTSSQIGFNSAQIVSDGFGYLTAVNATITLTYAHWWSNSGGTAVIGTHSNSGRPGSFTGAQSDRVRSGSWGRGARRTVSLGATVANELLQGTSKGIVLGPGPDGSTLYYGYAYGAGVGANQPILNITFAR